MFQMTLYTDSHEWVRLDGDVATVGITDHAQFNWDIVDLMLLMLVKSKKEMIWVL